MREILFRGKRVDNGEWVEGDLDRGLFANINFISYFESIGKRKCHEVIPETIGQYTGLTDKNGNEIFEGDIILVSIKGNKTICKVAWADSVAQFQLWQKNTIPHTPTNLNLGNYDCEVIGNIYDNPELLEREENTKKAVVKFPASRDIKIG